jgi:hypothetical protein
VLTAFGDESSDESHERVFSVGAVFGDESQWDKLQSKWVERTGGAEFHAAECDSDQGDYKRSSHGENKQLYKDLTLLLAQSGLWGYGVALDLISQRKYMPDLLPESPYYKCFGEVVIFFTHRAVMYVPREQVKFTFDRRLETQYNATALYDYMAKLPEWRDSEYLHDEIAFASRKTVGVQVADLWAREVMKRLDNEIGPVKRNPRKAFEALRGTGRFGATLYAGEYFDGLNRAIKAMDNTGEPGAFRSGDYKNWLQKHGLTDTYGNRVRYTSQYDAIQRAVGNLTHFEDVRRFSQGR